MDEDETTGRIELYYHGNMPKTSEVKELMSEYLNENIRSARSTGIGNTWMVITEDGDWWDVDLVQVFKMTYDGQTRWVRNVLVSAPSTYSIELINHDDVTFTSSDDLEKNVAKLINTDPNPFAASETTLVTFESDRSAFTYTNTAALTDDVELSDAYKVHTDNIYRELTDGTTINNDYYVAEGTEVVLTSGRGLDAGYYYFDFGDDKVGEYHFADSSTSFSETMTVTAPINVEMSDRAALVSFDGDYEEYVVEGDYYEFNSASEDFLINKAYAASADITGLTVPPAGTTRLYQVQPGNVNVDIREATQVNLSNANSLYVDFTVGANSGILGGAFIAVGEVLEVKVTSGYVTSVTLDGNAVSLSTGALNTDTVTFSIPVSDDSDPVVVTVASTPAP